VHIRSSTKKFFNLPSFHFSIPDNHSSFMYLKSNFSKAALAIAISLSLWGCKEKVSGFDFSNVVASDTTFIAPAVEAPQWRRVLIEEFTGVSCPPCPQGHIILKAILAQHHNSAGNFDSVSVIGIQSSGIPQAEPVHEAPYASKHDNRTADGSEIYNSVYGTFGAIPRAGIDRIRSNNVLSIAKDFWASTVTDRLKVPTAVNITLTSSYDAGTRQAIIKVHVAYTGRVDKKQNLNLAIIENDIIDAQKNDLEIDSLYQHEHVLRDMLTSATGSAMMGAVASKEPGRVYERTFIYDVNPDWVPENCRLIAYVTNNEGTDVEVQQSAEIPLK
jgi:hypothetical protein